MKLIVSTHEDLIAVLVLWYRCDPSDVERSFSSSQISILWTELWFAKGDEQTGIDEMLQSFAPTMDQFLAYEPVNSLETVALIILFDQITRNIYRRTPKAYAYDYRANHLARSLLSNQSEYDKLPTQCKLTVIVCLIHQEDLALQMLIYHSLIPALRSTNMLYVMEWG